MLVSEVLTEQHYRILDAKDGPSAFAILESGKRIDLMITDVGLPGGLNGRQIADRTRVLHPKLQILFITGYAENAAVSNHLGQRFLGSNPIRRRRRVCMTKCG
jgi:CheY-like chemotaxis protein